MKHAAIKYTLPNGEIIVLRYLYKRELDKLIKIPTTIDQAKRIIKRNRCLLRFKRTFTRFGCPHCETCWHCAWRLVFHYKEICLKQPCYHAKFSGLTILNVCNVIEYRSDGEDCYPHDFASCTDGQKQEMIDAEAFLRAHIEWAEAVILQGGIPWPNGKLTAVRQDKCFNKKVVKDRYPSL